MDIPETAPIMTLSETVFFPQVVLPLHIFEQRYRQMLAETLNSNRMFVVACRDDAGRGVFRDADPPPSNIATIGVIRAAHRNRNGTSNLVLQGIQRVRIRRIVREEPYRIVEIEPVQAQSTYDPSKIQSMRAEIRQILGKCQKLCNDTPQEFLDFLDSLDEPATFIDLLAYTVIPCPLIRQKVLEQPEVTPRFELVLRSLHKREHLDSLLQELNELPGHDHCDRN